MTTCHPIASLSKRKLKSVAKRIATPAEVEEKVRIPSKTLDLAEASPALSIAFMPTRVIGGGQISSVALRVP